MKSIAMAAKFTGVCFRCANQATREAAVAKIKEITRRKMEASTERRCLKCDEPFQSIGHGNRLCLRCARQNRLFDGERGGEEL